MKSHRTRIKRLDENQVAAAMVLLSPTGDPLDFLPATASERGKELIDKFRRKYFGVRGPLRPGEGSLLSLNRRAA